LMTQQIPIVQSVVAVLMFLVFVFVLFRFAIRVRVNMSEQRIPVNSPASDVS